MSFKDCINAGVSDGSISEDGAKQAFEAYDKIKDDLIEKHGAIEGERMARLQTVDYMDRTLLQQVENKLRTIENRLNILDDFKNSKLDTYDSIAAMLEFRDNTRFRNGYLQEREKTIGGRVFSCLDQSLVGLKKNLLGNISKSARGMVDDIVHEASGKDTGNALAKIYGQGWTKASDFSRTEFNRSGGRIGKIEGWIMPQMHNRNIIASVGRTVWKDFIKTTHNIVDDVTGNPLTGERLDKALDGVYDDIITNGFGDKVPSSKKGAGSLIEQHAKQRVLIPKSSDAFLKYNRQFGYARPEEIIGAMHSHLKSMARDTASLQVLGPDPMGTVVWLANTAKMEASLKMHNITAGKLPSEMTKADKKAVKKATKQAEHEMDKAKSAGALLYAGYAIHSGMTSIPVNSKVAKAFGNIRQFITVTRLGSAVVAAVPGDYATSVLTLGHLGGSLNRFNQFYYHLLKPGSAEAQKAAIRLGVVSDTLTTLSASQARYVDDTQSSEFFKRLTDGVLRSTGLTPVTEAAKGAFALEMRAYFAENLTTAFDDLLPPIKKAFENHGINANDWAILQDQATITKFAGTKMDVIDFKNVDMHTANLFEGFIHAEQTHAVIDSSLRTRAFLLGDSQPGTLEGEARRGLSMFKAFPVTVMTKHFGRSLAQDTMGGKLGYFAKFMTLSTVAGFIAYEASQVLAGRGFTPINPFDKNSLHTLTASILKGGGLGFLGDFSLSLEGRYGQGLPDLLGGPLVGIGAGLGRTAWAVGEGKQGFFGAMVGLLGQNTPVLSSGWYSKLIYKRALIDQLQIITDPKAHKRFKRLEKRTKKNYGQDYWWRRGEKVPEFAK